MSDETTVTVSVGHREAIAERADAIANIDAKGLDFDTQLGIVLDELVGDADSDEDGGITNAADDLLM